MNPLLQVQNKEVESQQLQGCRSNHSLFLPALRVSTQQNWSGEQFGCRRQKQKVGKQQQSLKESLCEVSVAKHSRTSISISISVMFSVVIQ